MENCLLDENLPPQVRRYLFIYFLDRISLSNLMQTNKKFYSFCSDNQLWRVLVERRFGKVKEEKNWKTTYQIHHSENDNNAILFFFFFFFFFIFFFKKGYLENNQGFYYINYNSVLTDYPKINGLEFRWSQKTEPNDSNFLKIFNDKYLIFYKDQKLVKKK